MDVLLFLYYKFDLIIRETVLNNTRLLRYIALAEGVSWLALLFIAMPLKYMAGNPLAVKYVGMTHGLLFIALVVLLMLVLQERLISKSLGVKVFIASLVPFGTFVVDRKLKAAYAQS